MAETLRQWLAHPLRNRVALREEFADQAFLLVPSVVGSGLVDCLGGSVSSTTFGAGAITGISEFGEYAQIASGGNSNNYIEWASEPRFNPPSTGYSMFFVGRRTANGGNTYNRIWHRDVQSSAGDGFGFLVASSGDGTAPNRVYFANQVAGVNTNIGYLAGNPVSSTTAFSYYLLTHDGATARLYLNGALIEAAACAVPASSTRVMRLGRNTTTASTGAPFDIALAGYVRACIPPALAFSPWQLLAPRRIWSPSAATGAPTLSDVKATNITATSVQGTYDYAF